MIVKYREPNSGVEVFVSDVLLAAMQKHVGAHYPKEFGGILSGIIHDNRYFILDIVMPKKYASSRVEFTRYPEGINEYLKTEFEASGGNVEYLGEWHSHPDGSTQFSAHDKETMLEIARDKKVKIGRPILVIVAVKKQSFEIGLYLCDSTHLLPMQLEHKTQTPSQLIPNKNE